MLVLALVVLLQSINRMFVLTQALCLFFSNMLCNLCFYITNFGAQKFLGYYEFFFLRRRMVSRLPTAPHSRSWPSLPRPRPLCTRRMKWRATPRGEMIVVSVCWPWMLFWPFCFVHIVTWNVVANKPFKTFDVQEEVCIQIYLFSSHWTQKVETC